MAAVEAVTSLVTKMQPCLACCNECEGEGEGVDLHAPRLVRTSVLLGVRNPKQHKQFEDRDGGQMGPI